MDQHWRHSQHDTAWRGWRLLAWSWALVIALGVGYFVWRIPVQVGDCLANLIQVQGQTWRESFTAGIGHGYMRPFLWAQIRLMYELADGEYTRLFRAVHVAQVLGCAALFVGALRVRDAAAALAVPFGLAMLFASHTMVGTLSEAFPINSFLSIVIACLAALALSLGPPARWRDAVAVLVFVTMVLTVESGILVWWCLVVAAAAGARGVSRRALAGATLCLLAYLVARFVALDVGTPGLLERSSGFGFRMLEGQELQARFGAEPWILYAYNVACQMATVLMGEPSNGVWVALRDRQAGALSPAKVLRLTTSLAATLLIAGYVAARFDCWRRRAFDDRDRVVVVFVAMLVANAAISFPYAKDVIVSPAAALHAAAASVALAALLRHLAVVRLPLRAVATLLIAAVAAGATVRLAGTCYILREASFDARNGWTRVEEWAMTNHIDITPAARATLVSRLREEALRRRTPAPAFADPDWTSFAY